MWSGLGGGGGAGFATPITLGGVSARSGVQWLRERARARAARHFLGPATERVGACGGGLAGWRAEAADAYQAACDPWMRRLDELAEAGGPLCHRAVNCLARTKPGRPCEVVQGRAAASRPRSKQWGLQFSSSRSTALAEHCTRDRRAGEHTACRRCETAPAVGRAAA